jgi:hypothetical protein
MSSPLVAPPVARMKTLHCPNCGGPVERRGFGHTLSVACPQCLSILDVSNPLVEIIQTAEQQSAQRTLLIPLGTRGTLQGTAWEAIGFQARQIEVDGEHFEWHEYLLFNPYKGFRYLTYYDGHWNFVIPLESIPSGGGSTAAIHGRSYKHFSTAAPVTVFVLGEFPWRVHVGDRVEGADFISPPYVLSKESTKDESTWSEGIYVPGREIWKAFNLPGSAPYASGVYLNQPSPYPSSAPLWLTAFSMISIALALMIFFALFSKRETVLEVERSFSATAEGEPSFVTRTFDLNGRPATVEVDTSTDLNNNWIYFNYALINDDTGTAYDFGREVSYYYGSDSDGSWNEGSRNDSALLPAVPPGRYYLRVEPEMESSTPVRFDIKLRHDVPTFAWFWIAIPLLLLPPIFRTIRSAQFERARWSESDHPPMKFTSSNEDDD